MYNPVYDLVNFTVGFVEPSRENDADEFANAGSGTLVTRVTQPVLCDQKAKNRIGRGSKRAQVATHPSEGC